MHVIRAINIRDAFYYALEQVRSYGIEEDTRIGRALVIQEPLAILYEKPKQHVLLDKWRDANPFFHLMEAMWMLAGRDDGAFLDNYIKGFSQKFGDEDGIIPDAYGYRWRNGLGFNQLDVIISQLIKNPATRQAVLQMWGAGVNDLFAEKIKPCNLVACFMIRGGKLDVTVFNRSNDLVLGCCGANAVHFPILQEYVAAMVGVEVGNYWQVTNNLHLYVDQHGGLYDHMNEIFNGHLAEYEPTQPLVKDPGSFNEDLEVTMEYLDNLHNDNIGEPYTGSITNPFLISTVIPMAVAYKNYRIRNMEDAFDAVGRVTAKDWRRAGIEWLERRVI